VREFYVSMILIAEADLATLLCKIEKYERFLHDIRLYSEIIMDEQSIRDLIANACRWSSAHRDGNGELSEEEVNERVFEAFKRLLNHS